MNNGVAQSGPVARSCQKRGPRGQLQGPRLSTHWAPKLKLAAGHGMCYDAQHADCRSIAKNYGRIREVEKELANLQLQVRRVGVDTPCG